MKVLQIHTKYRQSGGEDTVVQAEAALLRDAGHTVTLFEAQNHSGRAAAVQLGAAIWNPRSAKRLAAHIASDRPDVAHIHNTWFAMSPSISQVLPDADVPTVMTLHNYRLTCTNALLLRDGSPCEICIEGSPLQSIRYGCYRSRPETAVAAINIAVHRRRRTWATNIDLFFALTEFMKTIMVRAGIPEEKIVVKPNFTADPGPRTVPASESDTVVFLGRLSEEKGVHHLVSAWKTAPPADLRLKIAGDGPLRAELESEAPTSVEFLGHISHDKVAELLGTSRALVFPSTWYEGLPMTIVEAFASGLPVLANDLGAMASVVKPLGDDWLVSPETATRAESWMAALARLTDSEMVHRASAQARRAFDTNFTPQSNLKALERGYLTAVSAAR